MRGGPAARGTARSRPQALRVTPPGGKTWLGEEDRGHLQAEARGRWVGCPGSTWVPKPAAPAPATRPGASDPPHPTPPSLSLSGLGVPAIQGPECGAVKGQRPTPNVAGKDAARLHASQEAGPGLGDPGSDLTSSGGGREVRGTGKGVLDRGERARHWAPSLCPLCPGSGGLQVSLRGQGEGGHRRTRMTTQTLGAKATTMRRTRRKRRPARLRAAGAQVPAHPAPAWGTPPSFSALACVPRG